ncbi:2-C-methyl-D-erythritol 4-phosphate cytidylyltransferase [Pseudoramibacter alactolyticus]|uniref:2-C-methyl-D-erythritol 4-phosphate cytidylyltransferase n=1 Tax=Pseudoramibacter alactolyticus TaxID=113287 RepID=UPI0023554875|nr:2-C-methyl-D-erythritol 4-phosphate cytidylyltransferase [Pseudoramibacter alactolyticus]MBM6967948.1 2-C-methyl-D-erythritol 4-phosphate cytidylyltransferase [Pseudoramibacter alactolyticus]
MKAERAENTAKAGTADGKRHFITAVIPAAGQGSRMKAAMNKQYLTLAGKPILSYAIDAFEACELVNEIVVVINANERDIFRREVTARRRYRKLKTVIGGDCRQASVLNGLKGADPRCDLVMIHDGARPLISQQLILKCIAETLRTKATVVAVPAKNTIKVVRRENDTAVVDHTPDRENLYEVQTPQSFDYALIMAAYAKAAADGVAATDDASLVEHYGEPVTIVRGYYNNIKITTPEDLMIAGAVLAVRP